MVSLFCNRKLCKKWMDWWLGKNDIALKNLFFQLLAHWSSERKFYWLFNFIIKHSFVQILFHYLFHSESLALHLLCSIYHQYPFRCNFYSLRHCSVEFKTAQCTLIYHQFTNLIQFSNGHWRKSFTVQTDNLGLLNIS